MRVNCLGRGRRRPGFLNGIWRLGLVLACGAVVPASARTPADVDRFETKVRPLLAEHCYACHSAGARKLKGGLLLDSLEAIRKGGQTGPAVVPGKLDESLLIQVVRYEDELTKMPPKGKLPASSIAILEEWVKAGAHGPSARLTTAQTGPARKSPESTSPRPASTGPTSRSSVNILLR